MSSESQIDVLRLASFEPTKIVGTPDAKVWRGGKMLADNGQVDIINVGDSEAELEVWEGGDETFPVAVWVRDGLTYFECDCPDGRNYARNICVHKVAAWIELAEYFAQTAEPDWRDAVEYIVSAKPELDRRAKDVLAFSLRPFRGEWAIAPYVIPEAVAKGVDVSDRNAVEALAKSDGLSKKARALSRNPDVTLFANASANAVMLVRLLGLRDDLRYSRYERKGPKFGDLLAMLRGCLVFKGTTQNPLVTPVRVLDDPVTTTIKVQNSNEGLMLLPLMVFGPGHEDLENKELIVVNNDPFWVMVEDTLFQVSPPPEAVRRLIEQGSEFVRIPTDQTEEFHEKYLSRLAERAPLEMESVTWVESHAEPVPRIYLSDAKGELSIVLRFAYDGLEVPRSAPSSQVSVARRGEHLVRIHRDGAAEAARWSQMAQQGLKGGGDKDSFTLRARVDPLDFLIHHVPKLLLAGFEVYGQDDLTSVRVNRNRPSLKLSVSSGIDWFDVNAIAQFGEVELPLTQLYDAFKRRERYVKLADGSIGQLPPEWLARFRHLFALGDKKGDALRFSSRQQVLIEDALAESEQSVTDELYTERRERLRTFTEISQRPLPAGFRGELRHYQKSGFDWLHFLHDYEFGGCLADDMGIGKTVQTLVFLQSLKESHEAVGSNLIVMPRSLLFNWEREAKKFTPDLKILIHAENRTRQAKHFEKYDLVLTTYGVLLRDIEMLRKHRFHYVVLDESQAIKNPLSQTGRAARLLQTDHRLTLTGTPVENSTIELWSQFAFLNPGMLGSMDYFREEFATAIEKGQDETSAGLLRKMVFPFILRRTKDQVAPELPPRTERILFAEMDSAQQTLYDRIKATYRAELRDLIDQSGIAQSRMKVLEALLRLRQVANHPKLIDPLSNVPSAKFELLIETLGTLCSEGHKALVFSQFVQMLSLVRADLDEQTITYTYLDGQTRDRQQRVDEFQGRPDIPLFLISLKAGGVGLNLTAADYVIHIDPWWNPAVERQATDRTHRIGQDKPVFVYKFITRGTVEEKILELQDRKRALADQLVSTEQTFFKSLTAEDVDALFG